MPKVMIHPATYENVRGAVDRAFALFPLQLKGKKVLVKPNVLRGATPEEAITTHPAVLKAVVGKAKSLGPAEIVVGDNPGIFGYGQNEDCFRQTGLMEAAGDFYRNIGNDSVKVAFNPDYMPEVSLSQAAMDADIVISLPKFKTHGLTVMTGAVKNSYGLLPGAQKAKLHKAAGTAERFHDMMVEVFKLRVPDLFIMDAVVGMEGNGPASPDLRNIGRILASDNAVALDAVVAAMMGLDPGRLRFLRKAREEGLGDYDLRTVDIVGDFFVIPEFKLPPLGGEATIGNKSMQDLIHSKTVLHPQADPELCTGCGACVEQCPVSALSMDDDDLPRVDKALCIGCFCCQEICPVKAITLK